VSKISLPISVIVIRIVILAVWLSFFFEQAGARELLHLDTSDGPLLKTPAYWVSLVAPSFFLGGLWAASRALSRENRGDAFGPAMVCALNNFGYALMLGAFAAIVVQPSLIHLFANGFTEMRGVRFDIDVENVTLALVGMTLILLARRGQQLKTTLDEFV
jgi:hypothetical protein